MITIIVVEGKSKLCNFKPKADFCCHHWADICTLSPLLLLDFYFYLEKVQLPMKIKLSKVYQQNFFLEGGTQLGCEKTTNGNTET